jgi:hypothetical protein
LLIWRLVFEMWLALFEYLTGERGSYYSHEVASPSQSSGPSVSQTGTRGSGWGGDGRGRNPGLPSRR